MILLQSVHIPAYLSKALKIHLIRIKFRSSEIIQRINLLHIIRIYLKIKHPKVLFKP